MHRNLVIAIMLCAGLRVSAQEKLHPPGPGELLPDKLRKAIIDSLNKRQPFNAAPAQMSEQLKAIAGNGNLLQLKDTARQGFMQYLQQSNTSAQLQQYRKSLDMLKDSAAMNRFVDNKLRGFYALIPPDAAKLPLPRNIKNNFKGAALDATYGDTSGATNGWWNSIAIQDQFSLGSIPFDLNYSNLSQDQLLHTDFNVRNLMKVSFNKEEYMQELNKQVKKNYDLKKYFLRDIDYKSFASDFAGKKMDALRQQAGGLLDQMKQVLSVEELFNLDSLQLKNTLLKHATEEDMQHYREMLAQFTPETFLKDTAVQALHQRVQQYEATKKYYDQLLALKRQLGDGKDVMKIVNSQNAAERGLDTYANDPANTPKLAKQLLPMGFLQKLMTGMQQLNMGSFAANASKGTVSDMFMTGAAGSFFNNNKFLMAGLGKRSDIGLQHTGLESSIQPQAYAMQFMQMGTGETGKANNRIFALNANSKTTSQSQMISPAIASNIFVGTVSKQLELGEWGTLNAEFSKSNNSFSNTLASQPDLAGAPKAAVAGFLNDFWTTFSTRLNYSGSIKEYNLSQRAYINYSGLGYNNPGNPYGGRGSVSYGLDVKRSWLKNKASLRFKTDVRNMAQSPVSDSKWKNLQFSLDGHYRLNRRMSLDLRLNQASMNEKKDGHSEPVFMSRKASVMMQSSGKMGFLPYSANAMLGLQQMDYMMPTGFLRSTFVNFNIMKSVFIGSKSINWTLMYNKDIKNAAVYGNMLSSDLAYGYLLLKKISGTSALTYLNSENMVRQAGVRQTLSAQLLERWSVNLFIDARKDLYRGAQYYYYDNFRLETSIHYTIN